MASYAAESGLTTKPGKIQCSEFLIQTGGNAEKNLETYTEVVEIYDTLSRREPWTKLFLWVLWVWDQPG